MNKKQRNQNRANHRRLRRLRRAAELASYICPKCKHPGGHYVQIRGASIEALIQGRDDSEGYWLCTDFPPPDESATH